MGYSRYIQDDIRWLTNGISVDVLKEIFDAICKKKCMVVCNGYDKKVLRYTHQEGSFFIKQYTTKNCLEGIKSLFSLSKAHKEWACSHQLQRSQLLTAESVAVGEKRHFGILKDCYVISKAISNSMTVKESLISIQQSPASALNKKALLDGLISYVKIVHDLGVYHGELHAENILIDTNSPASFYLLDVGQAFFKKKLPLSFRIYELSRLLYSIKDVCTNEEIMGLISTYTNHLLSPKDGEMFCEAVLKKIYKIKKRFWYSRTRKCLKTNNVFKATTHAGYTVNMRNEWDASTLAALIDKHELSLNRWSDTTVKSSAKTGITRIPVSFKDIGSVCIKEYRYPSVWKRFFFSFRSSPARRAWIAAHGLMSANFRTPKPLALFEEKRTGILKKSFIIMEDISACLPCNTYVSEKFRNGSDKAIAGQKRRFVSCLAISFKRLHDSGTYHHDLKANNILIMELQDTWDFFYLDLDRVSFHKTITAKKKIKNLSQLNASIPHSITYTDRLRFYQAYSGIRYFTKADKHLLRSIVRLSIRRKHVWNLKISVPE